MKKFIQATVLSVSLLFINIGNVSAENVAVQGNLALIADGGLIAKNILTGEVNACFADGHFAPDGVTNVTDLLTTASAVSISANNAVVTYDIFDQSVPPVQTGIDVVTVDITSCLATTDVVVDVQECISTVDLDEGVLIIPCVEINGEVVTVHMEQRGNSSNWEVSFLGANLNFGSDDDDDDDHDHDHK